MFFIEILCQILFPPLHVRFFIPSCILQWRFGVFTIKLRRLLLVVHADYAHQCSLTICCWMCTWKVIMHDGTTYFLLSYHIILYNRKLWWGFHSVRSSNIPMQFRGLMHGHLWRWFKFHQYQLYINFAKLNSRQGL